MGKADARDQDAGKSVADQVAEFIGKSLGDLMNRKDALTRQMADVEQEISTIRARVMSQFGQAEPQGRRRGRPRGMKSAKNVAKARGRRQMSPETRAKMAEAARKRWAKARKSAKSA